MSLECCAMAGFTAHKVAFHLSDIIATVGTIANPLMDNR